MGPKGPHFPNTLHLWHRTVLGSYVIFLIEEIGLKVKQKTGRRDQCFITFNETTSSQQPDGLKPTTTWTDWGQHTQAHIHDWSRTHRWLPRFSHESARKEDVRVWFVASYTNQNCLIGGMNPYQQDKTIWKCIAANITGTHAVTNCILETRRFEYNLCISSSTLQIAWTLYLSRVFLVPVANISWPLSDQIPFFLMMALSRLKGRGGLRALNRDLKCVRAGEGGRWFVDVDKFSKKNTNSSCQDLAGR